MYVRILEMIGLDCEWVPDGERHVYIVIVSSQNGLPYVWSNKAHREAILVLYHALDCLNMVLSRFRQNSSLSTRGAETKYHKTYPKMQDLHKATARKMWEGSFYQSASQNTFTVQVVRKDMQYLFKKNQSSCLGWIQVTPLKTSSLSYEIQWDATTHRFKSSKGNPKVMLQNKWSTDVHSRSLHHTLNPKVLSNFSPETQSGIHTNSQQCELEIWVQGDRFPWTICWLQVTERGVRRWSCGV